MSKYFFHVRQPNLLTYCLYMLFAATIVTKSMNCFVLENTKRSRQIAGANQHEMSDNATATAIDDGNDSNASTDFLPKISDDDSSVGDNKYSTSANDVTSMDDIETGKYWLDGGIIVVKSVFSWDTWRSHQSIFIRHTFDGRRTPENKIAKWSIDGVSLAEVTSTFGAGAWQQTATNSITAGWRDSTERVNRVIQMKIAIY